MTNNHSDNSSDPNIPTKVGIIKDYNHFYIEPGESDINLKFLRKTLRAKIDPYIV